MDTPTRRPDVENEPAESSLLSRRKPRENAIEKLQEGYNQVVGLIDSIHKHMEVQDRRTEQIVAALNRLAETTAKLPDIADNHSERLATIAAQLEASSERAARWEQNLLDVPKIIRAQHDTLKGIGRELAAVKTHEVSVAETLDALRSTLTTWSDASKASNDRFIELQAAASQRDQRMEELVREHNRRFTWFFASTVVLAVAAISTAIISLIR